MMRVANAMKPTAPIRHPTSTAAKSIITPLRTETGRQNAREPESLPARDAGASSRAAQDVTPFTRRPPTLPHDDKPARASCRRYRHAPGASIEEFHRERPLAARYVGSTCMRLTSLLTGSFFTTGVVRGDTLLRGSGELHDPQRHRPGLFRQHASTSAIREDVLFS
jgi:hypothetical protein